MNFDKMMAELRTEYVASIPQKIKEIEDHLAAWTAINDSENAEALRNDFHKLKGTGKTYGIPEISELGEAVEKICLRKPEQISAVIPVAIDMLKQTHTSRTAGNAAFDVINNAAFAPIYALAKTIQK